jgi:DoxX-like protein
MSTTTQKHRTRASSIRLWVAQVIVAAVFLFAGGFKLVTPTDALAAVSHLNGELVKFIGVCETLGALGLILPGVFRVRRELTPIAALGLVIIMIGAVAISAGRGHLAEVPVPLVVGLLAAYIARGRWSDTTRPIAPRRAVLRPASH